MSQATPADKRSPEFMSEILGNEGVCRGGVWCRGLAVRFETLTSALEAGRGGELFEAPGVSEQG